MRKMMLAMAMAMATVAVAGCGSGDDGASSAKGGTSTVTLGMINFETGPIAYPDRRVAAEAAVRAMNERGGLAGHPVKLVTCDDKSTADGAAQCARQMVQDKIAALVGNTALEDQIVTPILAAAKIPMVGGNARTSVSLNNPYVYETSAGSTLSYTVLAAYAAKKLGEKVTLLSADNPAATGLRALTEAQLAKGGVTFDNTVLVSPTAADYAPLVEAAARNGGKAVVFFLPLPQAAPFMKAAGSSGKSFTYLGSVLLDSVASADLGGEQQLRNAIVAVPYPLATTAKVTNTVVKQYIRELAAYKKATGNRLADPEKQVWGLAPWFPFYALEQVLKSQKVTDPSSANIKRALDATKDLDLGGVIPPWTPSKPGPDGLARLSNLSYYLVSYASGKPELVSDKPVTVENAVQGKF